MTTIVNKTNRTIRVMLSTKGAKCIGVMKNIYSGSSIETKSFVDKIEIL